MSKLLRILLALFTGLTIVSVVFLFIIRRDGTATTMQPKKVFILRNGKKFTLYRNGHPFFIKGAAGTGHLARLSQAGGNTLRTWDTTHLQQILDDAAANNIAVIAGLSLPFSFTHSFYDNTSLVTAQFNAYRDVIRKYRSHPALLMWSLGNEVDFPYSYHFRRFYKVYNELLDMIHQEDPDHPVSTAIINVDRRNILNIKMKVPDLDLITLNTFGKLSQIDRTLSELTWCWNGPFLISEWGTNGPWEAEYTVWGAPIETTSTNKAQQYLERSAMLPVNSPRFLGACCFFWGQKQESTHTWYSLFSEDGKASETVNVLQQIWTGTTPTHHAPSVKYMLLNGKGAQNNILLQSDGSYTAELLMDESQQPDSTTVSWEILAEDWVRKDPSELNLNKPATINAQRSADATNKWLFRAPKQEGPYRIFVTVFDNKGYFSTANTPFYVVEK
ncbi:hypothetical protein LZZ85_00390 [Terrimonas sp. NA20]|uniref:Glycoside hydrolase family 2 catalytic domain-containing protein n=1 Tax=Terrimonas ginsenosidimutans TaxID=2908004 RepID=A0ABS9KK70_9BACT|nr:glycoside hydrolase family 2 TIM barrel-domain containing protein [Terrimonas ginsenosidimutans]MCG2612708.1 hypothetical protein [Terrimonas ginsenosidimutans]